MFLPAIVSAETLILKLTTGVIPGAGSDGAYDAPAFVDGAVDLWPARFGGLIGLGANLLGAGFVPDNGDFGRSVLIAPSVGLRVRTPLRASNFVIGSEASIGAYSRWTEIDGSMRNSRRPIARVIGELLFLDAYRWESGVRVGYVAWFDDETIHSAYVGIVAGRRW